ncbi:MAG: ABC transporter ATP-binding protein/permease [Lactobacillales bacterium]|jgi:ABC-type multidrug transport system fused ATPase/permease subunit|nr:ABC transporter ATP-binding protein/permease [Lactobacillales bacterium]
MTALTPLKNYENMQKSTPPPVTVSDFIWHYVRQFKLPFFTVLFLVFLHRATYIFWPYSGKLIVDAFQKYIESGSPVEQILSYVGWVFALFIGMWIFGGVIFRIHNLILSILVPKMKMKIKQDVFARVQENAYHFFINNFAGNITTKINDLGQSTVNLLWLLTVKFFGMLVLFIFTFLLFTAFHWSFFAIAIFWMTFHLGYCYLRMKRWNKLSETASEKHSVLTGRMIDSIGNYTNVKLFAAQKFEMKSLFPFFESARREEEKKRVTINWDYVFLNIMCPMLLYAPIFAMLVYLFTQGKLGVGDIIFIVAATDTVADRTYELGDELTEITEHYGTLKQAIWVATCPITVADDKNARDLKVKHARIDFNQVDFRYDGAQKDLFRQLTLNIKPGERVGIVGYSGAGKSTLIHLLLRYFDAQGGTIEIDGQNIHHITQKSLRDSIAFIPQDTSLFHRSIYDNIRYGRQNATQKDVIAAAKKAYIHDLILSTPDGYDSLVGDRGVKLSVGQRQRIAIARAILKNAPILILDEATSALDSETEVNIQKSLESLMKGRTTIAIAHRLSTLRSMDRIIVLDKGRITEEGSHGALIRKKGLYAHLWEMQSDGFIGLEETLPAEGPAFYPA